MKSQMSGILTGLIFMSSLTACSFLPQSSEPSLGAARASSSATGDYTESGTRLSVSGVLFEFEQATLKPQANEMVSKAVTYLLDNPDSHVVVEGHTDHLGTRRYNQRLSEKRANAIARALKSNGISAERIKAVGYGESRPVASNKTADGRQANRRVEIILQNDF